jgi:3-methyladenine DNA glycosylase AlkD
MKLNDVLLQLEKLGDPEVKKTKERFAINPKKSYGIFLKDLKAFAKQIGPNDDLALQLFDTGIYEAMILCSKMYNRDNITDQLMEKWIKMFDNWEICDTFCMGLFGKSAFAVAKALEWSGYEAEYQKRAGFVCMVSYAFTHKHATNEEIRQFFPIMIEQASDERAYVMKGINWALRQVGKRNPDLYKEAIEVANEILRIGSKPARWIAEDALRQLKNPNVYFKNYPIQ